MTSISATPQQSPWADALLSDYGPLTSDETCNVCIVGGGIAGLLVAERLIRDGFGVIVLEQGAFAQGETLRTTAHFVTALDDRYEALGRMHGTEGARLAAESHVTAIAYVEQLVQRLGSACRWRRLDGYLTVNERHRAKREALLEAELAAALSAGLAVSRVDALPEPWPASLGPALCFAQQAQVHPLILLRSVAASVVQAGGRLHAHTHVTAVHGGLSAYVETARAHRITCDHVVIATNTPMNTRVAVHTKQSGYQTYVMAFHVPAGALAPLLLWDGLWEDDDAYRYVRLISGDLTAPGGSDLLMIGGEDHKTGQGPTGVDPWRNIEVWTRTHFPMCGDVAYRWSGEVMEPADGLAYIGRNPVGHDNIYIVTGDSGNGMTHSAIAAMLVPDLIQRKTNRWAGLYDPARKVSVRGLGTYAKENLNTIAQYSDWLKCGEVTHESEIPLGHGAIVRQGLHLSAVYKDEQGVCNRSSAVCPHLGGIVRWNSQARTWDCPCHGSRFDCHGALIHGPANRSLEVSTR